MRLHRFVEHLPRAADETDLQIHSVSFTDECKDEFLYPNTILCKTSYSTDTSCSFFLLAELLHNNVFRNII